MIQSWSKEPSGLLTTQSHILLRITQRSDHSPLPFPHSLCYPQGEGRWRVRGRGGEARAGQMADGNSGYCKPDEVEAELMAVGSWEGIGKQRPGWELVTL